MFGTLFVASCFSAACKDQQKNTIILNNSTQFTHTVVTLQTIQHLFKCLFLFFLYTRVGSHEL